ncbi:hypothetical protein [Cognatitamlana onchidii]|uniref:hypothetical protein n=1 Tax=Cognatitamlana onchidii TaxID=2562860 RepID=UPI0010A5B9EC|nr:hypothetical protein [Algibacter onchidii]
MKKRLVVVLLSLLIISCNSNDDTLLNSSLSAYVTGKTTELGGVIACAASDMDNSDTVLTFYYPEEGATNIRLYETNTVNVDEKDFNNYVQKELNSDPVFNGYLGVFRQNIELEKWAIVTFELGNEIKISNPIRLKQKTKVTVWTAEVLMDLKQVGMPCFLWPDNAFGDNAIYFQVISDSQDNLLSGTYTFQNQFQYYNTDNVVLNITTQEPPNLETQTRYNFTLMDVSEDNWVNWVIQTPFEIP